MKQGSFARWSANHLQHHGTRIGRSLYVQGVHLSTVATHVPTTANAVMRSTWRPSNDADSSHSTEQSRRSRDDQGCLAEPDQGDEHTPNGAAGDMAGVGTSLTLHAGIVRFFSARHATKRRFTLFTPKHAEILQNTPFHAKTIMMPGTDTRKHARKMHGTSKPNKTRQLRQKLT